MGDRSITWQYEEVTDVHKRRYLLQNTAIEIFLSTGRTFLLAFPAKQERNNVYLKVSVHSRCFFFFFFGIMPLMFIHYQLMEMVKGRGEEFKNETTGILSFKRSITEMWRRGEISNFEYLMHLNTLAGRSFNGVFCIPNSPGILYLIPFLLHTFGSIFLISFS